ncbi:MAG: hypothetical protein KGJ90_00315 [Patescibacteria group bacterium]|nr:hypothetical protein [Patescibacteria group bacterium]
MSRSGYTDEDYDGQLAMWRGQVANSIRGKRGQKMLRDLLTALDSMPEKQLISGHLENSEGVCALGALGQYRHIDMSNCEKLIDIYGYCEDFEMLAELLSKAFDITPQLAREIQYLNDEFYDFTWEDGKRRNYTPEERWQKMRAWVQSKIKE